MQTCGSQSAARERGDVSPQSFLRNQIYRIFRFNVVAFVMRLVTGAVVARVMGPAAMGLWVLLSLLPTYAEGFGRLKADLAAVYVLGQRKWSLGEVCAALNVIALLTGGVFALALLLAERWVSTWLFGAHAVDPMWYRLTVCTIPIHFLAMGYAYLLLHFDDVRAYNVQNFLRSVLPGILAAVLLLLTPLRIGALVGSLFTGSLLGLGYAAWVVHRREPLRPASRPGLYGELLHFGKRLYLAGMIEHLNTYLSSAFVGLHLAARDLAFFRLGQDRLQVLDQIPSSVNTVLYPKIAKASASEDQADLVAKSIRVLVILLGVAAAAGAVLAPFVVWLLYGEEFLPMVWSIWLLLPGVVALGMSSPATQYFMGSGRAGLVWKLALVPLLIQAAALLPLMRLAGFRGAALAVSLSWVAHAVLRLLLLGHVTGRDAFRLMVPTNGDLVMVWGFLLERTTAWARRG